MINLDKEAVQKFIEEKTLNHNNKLQSKLLINSKVLIFYKSTTVQTD